MLQVFGTPSFHRPDGRRLRCEGTTLALLAYLAVEGPTSRARLASLLWPASAESVARNNLVHLRRRVASMARTELILNQDLLTLSPVVWTDVQALVAGTLPPERLPGATFLSDVTFGDLPELTDWMHLQRERLLQLSLRQLHALRAAAEQQGELAQALGHAERILALDDLSEDAHRHVMRLAYLTGDRGAALATYRACAARLERDLGVAPMPDTVRLAEDITRGEGPLRPAGRVSSGIPLAVQRPPVLVGREREWRRMEEARARGHVIFLAGEAGTGKTRLAEEFAARHGPYLRLEGRPGDQQELYASAVRLLRRHLAQRAYVPPSEWERLALAHLLPEFGAAPPESWHVLHFQQAILHLVRETSRDVRTLITDDLQHYDQASFELGGFLLASGFPLGQPGGLPHFVDTYRTGELPPAIEAAIQALVNADLATVITVGALDEAAADRLMDTLGVPDHAGWRRRVWRHAGGNLVFLLETIKFLLESGALDQALPEDLPLPARVQQTISARLSRLSAPALQVARAAATLQRDFTLDLLAEVLQAPVLEVAERWAELERAQVVLGEQFPSGLIAQTITHDTPDVVRKVLHRNAARALERHQADPGLIAWHWRAGEQDRQAAPWFMRAGAAALRKARLLEARGAFEDAQRAFERSGDEAGARDAALACMALDETRAAP